MNFIGIIPARYNSSRLPGKPLVDICGKTMLQRVIEQCIKSKKLNKVVVATDDNRILEHVNSLGFEAIITDKEHQSGTDRCFEAAQKINCAVDDIIINIQGDEPFINPLQIDLLTECFNDETVEIASLCKKISLLSELENPSIPKLIFDKNNNALLFSRSVIPYNRNAENKKDWLNTHTYFKHIGIYAYRHSTLKNLVTLEPSKLEKTESLEQLRWLENGYKIKIAETTIESLAVDTPSDLEKAKEFCLINKFN